MRVVLGADVLIGALDSNDPHHSRARTLFRSWQRRDASLFVSIVNSRWRRRTPQSRGCCARR
jgi:predicted nucleic acid-binding protein